MPAKQGQNQIAPETPSIADGVISRNLSGIPISIGDPAQDRIESVIEERFFTLLKRAYSRRCLTNCGDVHEQLERVVGDLYDGRECVLFANTSIALSLFLVSREGGVQSHADSPEHHEFVMVTDSVTLRQLAAIDWAALEATGIDQAVWSGNDSALLLNPNDFDAENLFQLDESYFSRNRVLVDYSGLEMPDTIQCHPAAFLFDLGNNNVFADFHAACIVTDDVSLAQEMRCQRNFGFNRTDAARSHSGFGRRDLNAKLNEVHAAMALAHFDNSETHFEATANRAGNSLSAHRSAKHVGQINLPEWTDLFDEMQNVLRETRRGFTSFSVRAFEEQLAEFLEVEHVICTTSCTAALMVMLRSMELAGEVIVPSFTFPATVQAIEWAGLSPQFCDVEHDTHSISARLAAPLINSRTAAILGMHCWGRPCDPHALEDLCLKQGLKLVFDAAHSFGCSDHHRSVSNFGTASAFSFHATKIVNCSEGGCIATNDSKFAERIRANISESAFDVGMSPAQAAMGQLSLSDFFSNRDRNRRQYELYRDLLGDVPGITFVDYAHHFDSAYQQIVLEIDAEDAFELQPALLQALRSNRVIAKRYYWPGVHQFSRKGRSEDRLVLPNTERLCDRVFQLPSGSSVSTEDIARISELVRRFFCSSVCDH